MQKAKCAFINLSPEWRKEKSVSWLQALALWVCCLNSFGSRVEAGKKHQRILRGLRLEMTQVMAEVKENLLRKNPEEEWSIMRHIWISDMLKCEKNSHLQNQWNSCSRFIFFLVLSQVLTNLSFPLTWATYRREGTFSILHIFVDTAQCLTQSRYSVFDGSINELKGRMGDFPGSPVVKTLHLLSRRHEFHPWLGNYNHTCCVCVCCVKNKR